MQNSPPPREKRYHSVDAIVRTSFTEGICPDLLYVVEQSQLRDENGQTATADSTASMQDPVAKPPQITSLKSKNTKLHRNISRPPLYTSEPDLLNSPDGVFSNSRFSKLSFFSAVTRRSSAPNPCSFISGRRMGVAFSPSPVIIISSSGEESPADLRKASRDFGSAGDLLGEPRPLSAAYRSYLGKSLQHVSAD